MGRVRLKCMKLQQKKFKAIKQTKLTVTVWQKIASEINDQKLRDDVVISMEKMLERLPQVNAKCNIYQVIKMLSEMNPKAYVPQLISIGPFHHGTRKDLIANEQYKLRGFINFLRRINIESIVEGGIPETARSLKDLLKTGTLKVLVEKAHDSIIDSCLSFLGHILFSGCCQKRDEENNETKNNDFLTLLCYPLCHLWNKIRGKKKSEKGSSIPPSITELCEAGVSIKKAENGKYMRRITFRNGVLEIPPLHIYDNFELVFRNMVAFEQYTARNRNKYVTQYVLFLDNLISTEKDVHLLVKAGVIINNIGGSDKEVSDVFNNIGKFVTVSSSFHFDSISEALHKHCNGRWNRAKASLKRNYFNTPWAFISFFAATLLILLTILQTIFTAISTFPKKPT